eukprot:3206400-Amphidinium_carterae.1
MEILRKTRENEHFLKFRGLPFRGFPGAPTTVSNGFHSFSAVWMSKARLRAAGGLRTMSPQGDC